MRERPGPKGAARHVTTSAEAFNLFIPYAIMDKTIQRTNEEGERLARARDIQHMPVAREEMLAFLSLLILRGSECDRRCEIRALFYDPFSRPFYRATMSVNRFNHLLRILRFDDRETRDEREKVDKFAAIREVFEDINSLLRVHYTPSECIT